MTFTSRQTVRFAHVDAAGIVFYPRYFEMVNASVEDYFAQAVGVDFAAMHIGRRIGVPTVKLDAEFVAPSRLGDVLDFCLTVDHVGTSSAAIAVRVVCADQVRARLHVVLVCMDLDSARAMPWPADLRPAVDGSAEHRQTR